jgi:hypothetical protein
MTKKTVDKSGFGALLARQSRIDARPIAQLIDTLLPTVNLSEDAREFFVRCGVISYFNDQLARYRTSMEAVAPDGGKWYANGKRVNVARPDKQAIGLAVPLLVRIIMESADGENTVTGLDATVDDWHAMLDRERGVVNGSRRRQRAVDGIVETLNKHKAKCAKDLPKKGAELDIYVERGWQLKAAD